MKKYSVKSVLTAALIVIVFSSAVLAAPDNLFNKIRDKLMSIADEFTGRDSQLTLEGDALKQELLDKVNEIEDEIRNNIEEYEKEQINEAKETLRNRINEIITQIENEKENIENEIKKKVKDKIDSDLERELEKIEDALNELE